MVIDIVTSVIASNAMTNISQASFSYPESVNRTKSFGAECFDGAGPRVRHRLFHPAGCHPRDNDGHRLVDEHVKSKDDDEKERNDRLLKCRFTLDPRLVAAS